MWIRPELNNNTTDKSVLTVFVLHPVVKYGESYILSHLNLASFIKQKKKQSLLHH